MKSPTERSGFLNYECGIMNSELKVVIIYRSLGYARDDIGVECVFSTEVSASERSGEIYLIKFGMRNAEL